VHELDCITKETYNIGSSADYGIKKQLDQLPSFIASAVKVIVGIV